MFLQLLQSAEMSPFLGTQDYEDMYEYYTGFPDGKASYSEFFGLVREAILRVYRAKDPSEVSPKQQINTFFKSLVVASVILILILLILIDIHIDPVGIDKFMLMMLIDDVDIILIDVDSLV